MASSTAYIIMLDAKTGVFTLISEKDELTIDKSHKKYEWLKGQEAGRIVKISEKGRWNSSRDYNNLYQSIKPKRKAPKKQKIAKTNKDKAGAYCFSFDEKKNHFLLIDSKGTQVQINSAHKKFEWLQSQDTGRIIKISEKGRWNSSKDYDGLYDEINSSLSKKKSSVERSVKIKVKKSKSIETKPTKSNTNELANLKDTVHHLKDKLDKREKEWRGLLKAKKFDKSVINQLKKEVSNRNKKIELLENQITQLKKSKSLTSKPKPSKPKKVEKKQWEARFTVTESAINIYSKKRSKKTKRVKITTKPLEKKPSERFLKQQLKLQVANNYNYNVQIISGLHYAYHNTECPKISNIILEWIREY